MEESYKETILDKSIDDESLVPPESKYPTIRQAVIFFLVMIGCQILVGIPGIAVEKYTSLPTPVFNSMGLLVSFLLMLLFIHVKRGHSNYSFKMPPLIAFIPFILLAMTMPILLEPAVSLIPMPDWIIEVFKELIGKDFFSFLSIVIIAPFFEELIFRGAILRGFLKNYSPQKAIMWSAFFFGLAHMNPWQFIGAFFAGMLLGWVYLKTKSLVPCILIHAVNNGFSFLLMFYVDDIEETFRSLLGNDTQYLLFYLGSSAIFVGCIYFLNNLFNKMSSTVLDG